MKPSSISPLMVHNNAMDYETYSDDEHSTSSTVMVNAVSPKKAQSMWMENPAVPVQKSVSFSPCAYEAQSVLVLEPEDIQKLWWTPAELKQNREDKHERVKQIYHFDKQQERAGGKSARHSFTAVLHRIFEACCEVRSECDRECITQSDVQRFNLYIHAMDYRHGLERATSEMLANDKMGRRQYLVETILRLQKEWCHHLNQEMLAEFLRDASENVSRPSRLFARRLATAHAFLPNSGNAHHHHHSSASSSVAAAFQPPSPELCCTR